MYYFQQGRTRAVYGKGAGHQCFIYLWVLYVIYFFHVLFILMQIYFILFFRKYPFNFPLLMEYACIFMKGYIESVD